MRKNYILIIGLAFLSFFPVSFAVSQTLKPSKVVKSIGSDVSMKLTDIEPVPYGLRNKVWKNKEVPNEFDIINLDENKSLLNHADSALQPFFGTDAGEPVIIQNFAGINNNYGVAPPDTHGDVGPNHYFQMVNMGFAIWDKNGTKLYGPVDNITLWSGFPGPWSSTNDGDPVVLYDEYAGRWIATQFSLPNYPNGPFYELVAVSKTGDPTGAWNRYAFEFDNMPDYPKFGVWPDGYYMTCNQFASGSGDWMGAGVAILDREAMINGDAEATMVFFDMGTGVGSLLPSDADGAMEPASSTPATIVEIGAASLKMWNVTVDWENVENSSVDYYGSFPVAYYTSNGINISQPGTSQKLSTLADRLMYRLQYRNFGDYEVMLTNHTVKADETGRAGIRWYEMRNYGAGWALYQQGTYAPFDNNSRWMASIAMNSHGDIALGYSVSGPSVYPEIRCAMQSAEALSGPGILDVDEIVLKPGLKSQTGIDRWGDYSAISVDPSDGLTFWFTTEYSNGSWSWRTQISSFFYAQPLVANFSTEEPVIPVGESVDFTDNTSGSPETWNWSFEGGEPSSSTEQNPSNIVYNQEGDFNVTLTVTNQYGEDELVKSGYITASKTVLPEVNFTISKQLACTIDTIQLNDKSNHKPIQWNWQFEPNSVTFLNGTSAASQNPQVVFNENTTYAVTLQAWNLNGLSELTIDTAILVGGIRPYYLETFTDIDFVSQYWTVENPDNDNGWQQYLVSGNDFDFNAVGIDFHNFDAIGHRDRLISPPFNLEGLSSASLEFQHAYAKRLNKETDSLIVYVSGDCGQSWTRIFAGGEDGSGNFATHEQISDFWPIEDSDWCIAGWGATCFTLDLSPWAGMANVKLAFEGYNNNGNPLFIDNVAISQFVGQDEQAFNSDDIIIFPNPNSGSFSFKLPVNNNFDKLQIRNILSQVVYKAEITNNKGKVDINLGNSIQPGTYVLLIEGNGKLLTKKIVIN